MFGSVREQAHRERWKPEAPGKKEYAVGDLAERRDRKWERRGRVDHRNGEEGGEGGDGEIKGRETRDEGVSKETKRPFVIGCRL